MGSKAFKKLLPIALAVAGNAIAPGIGGAVGSAVGTKATGGSWGDALKSGAFSYAGGKIGGALGGSSIGKELGLGGSVGDALGGQLPVENNIADFLKNNVGQFMGDTTANTVGASIANAGVGETLGAYAGSQAAAPGPKAPSGPAPFNAKQQSQQDLPGSLSTFGSLTPEQQSSNIATQGVYGGGAGPQEQSYFLNLINRRLVDQSGHLDKDLSEVNPIENSYLSNLGLGGYGDTKSLLEAMSKWKSA